MSPSDIAFRREPALRARSPTQARAGGGGPGEGLWRPEGRAGAELPGGAGRGARAGGAQRRGEDVHAAVPGGHPPVSAGRVAVAGHDVAEQPVEAKRALAFLPDEPRLFEYLTVWEHLNFIARLYGVADWEARGRALLAEMELAGKERALPGELSRGMKQKLSIACGFLHEPRLILLDEPLTGLDPLGIRRMKASPAPARGAGGGAGALLAPAAAGGGAVPPHPGDRRRAGGGAGDAGGDPRAAERGGCGERLAGGALHPHHQRGRRGAPGASRLMSFSRAVAFLWWASLRNRVRKQVQRLRQPKYLVGLLVGGAYLYAIVLRRLNFQRSVESLPPERPGAGRAGAGGHGDGVAWPRPGCWGRTGLRSRSRRRRCSSCSPAPVSRRGLLHYKLARGLFGAGVAAFFSTIFIGRGLSSHPVLFFLGAAVVLGTVNLHVHCRLLRAHEAGAARGGWGRRCGGWCSWRCWPGSCWAVYAAVRAHPFPEGGSGRRVVEAWLTELLEQPALHLVLWPARALVALPMAEGVRDFLPSPPGSAGAAGGALRLGVGCWWCPSRRRWWPGPRRWRRERDSGWRGWGHMRHAQALLPLEGAGPRWRCCGRTSSRRGGLGGPEMLLVLALGAGGADWRWRLFSPGRCPRVRQ